MGSKKAVALRYDKDKDKAPRVVAKGLKRIAEKIIEVAEKEGIPVKEDDDLVELLIRLELFEEIPPELYMAIAEVFAYVYRISRKYEELAIENQKE